MKLYTTNGDDGNTSLIDGRRVPKDDPCVAAFGNVDELNSLLGWCRAADDKGLLAPKIEELQGELFVLGAELATPEDSRKALQIPVVSSQQCEKIEQWIDQATQSVEALQHFVLPGGSELACRLHIARTRCRFLERSVVTLSRKAKVRSEVIVYLNRLGDLLFAWARLANNEAHLPDHIWKPGN
jgi:cob(I)alamin adenosyltransferase